MIKHVEVPLWLSFEPSSCNRLTGSAVGLDPEASMFTIFQCSEVITAWPAENHESGEVTDPNIINDHQHPPFAATIVGHTEQQMRKRVCLEAPATFPAFRLAEIWFDAALRSSSILGRRVRDPWSLMYGAQRMIWAVSEYKHGLER